MSCILVVEGDASLCEILSLALADAGYEVRTAPDGMAALTAVHEHPPALILVQERLPLLDGPAFVTVYRQTPEPHAPIIALMTDSHPIAADGILAMPFDLTDLFGLVRQYTDTATKSWLPRRGPDSPP